MKTKYSKAMAGKSENFTDFFHSHKRYNILFHLILNKIDRYSITLLHVALTCLTLSKNLNSKEKMHLND